MNLERFIVRENISRFVRLLREETDEGRRGMLSRLLDEAMRKLN